MRHFNLYRRGKIFYVRFKDEITDKWLSAISTGETDERAALATVYGWERDGIPSKGNRSPDSVISTRRLIDGLRGAELADSEVRQILDIFRVRGYLISAVLPGDRDLGPVGEFLNRPLEAYLEWFWDYEKSSYIQNKLRHGHSMGRTHCAERQGYVRNHWKPWLRDNPVTLAGTTRVTIDRFSAHLSGKGLSSQTKNHLLTTVTAALTYAYDVRVLPENPAAGITFYSVNHVKRGTLSQDEIRRLFSLDWTSEVAKIANLTAATTGLRAGEVAALTIDDVKDDRLHVHRSWSKKDGLKSTKTGEIREVPLIPAVRDQLREYAGRDPQKSGFIFWSVDPDRPMDPRRFYDGLRDALALFSGMTAEEVRGARRAQHRRGIKKSVEPTDADAWDRFRAIMDEWQSRRISFHSWRHHYAATMAGIVDRRAMMATGHRSAAVFEVYADHATAEQFREVSDAATLAFSSVLTFPGADPEEVAQ